MDTIKESINGLYDKNHRVSSGFLCELMITSFANNSLYPYFDDLEKLLDSLNANIRSFGLILIAYNARWDSDCKINKIIDKYLKHILDEKPTVSIQCIKLLPRIIEYKPELVDKIYAALKDVNLEKCPHNKQSSISKEIKTVLENLSE